MARHRTFLLATGALALAGCPKDNPPDPARPATSAATATTAAVSGAAAAPGASAGVAAPPSRPPACKISSEKVWGSGANKLTGLTAIDLADGRVAIGLALGNDPHVLVVGRSGDGKLVRITPKPGTDLAKTIKSADGTRSVLRVTPTKVDSDHVNAFVDYRDEYKDKRRHVACGPADGDAAWISFDGTPLLDRKDPPTGDERVALFKSKDSDGDAGYHELRDCRTFSDLKKNETWIIGSELRAVDKPDATTEWKTSLVIDRGPSTHEVHLHELDLKGTPPHIINFEVPMLQKLHGGSYVLTARYGGSLLGAILNEDKTLHGGMVSWGGFPTRPDVATDGDDTIIATSISKGNSEFSLRALRISAAKPELPKALSPIVTDEDNKDSESEPDFTRDSKGRRWVSYIDGERGNGHLEIVPVDANFHFTGLPFEITKEDDRASEARLVEMSDGTILVAFLRETGPKVELVTEDLDCEIIVK
jgi:hypothetical protein